MKDINKYRGCLVGGAVGDALGYAVEFLGADQIRQVYGKNGITEYDLSDGIAQISDDTQMTLFTATGLLYGTTRGMTRGIMAGYPDYIASCYGDWLDTQNIPYPGRGGNPHAWLVNIPELYHRRAPGNTCLFAIAQGAHGTMQEPINDSKGCGGIMRVSPIGLYFGDKPIVQDEIDRIGAETAALTHGHELGYIPAAAMVHIVHLLAHREDATVLFAVQEAMSAMQALFPEAKHMEEFLTLMHKAIALAASSREDLGAIHELGGGWVAEETLAIAVYCALKWAC